MKSLPIPGEVFQIAQRPAFLIRPDGSDDKGVTPWVWYAPTLPKHPGREERWMFERFLDRGLAVAGVDVGESYGSPAGVAVFDALYQALTTRRGLADRPALLARSRGGLMLYNWAADHPGSVACIAGIYPVCNLASYPGLAEAAPAFALTEAALAQRLAEFNPIDRLDPLAAAGVPIFHRHGDRDTVVPIADNSAKVKVRYEALGGWMRLEIVEGGGHDLADHWFQSPALVDFVTEHAGAAKP